jgi:hypothetical protein
VILSGIRVYHRQVSVDIVVAYSRYFPSLCIEGLKKMTKELSQDRPFTVQDSN